MVRQAHHERNRTTAQSITCPFALRPVEGLRGHCDTASKKRGDSDRGAALKDLIIVGSALNVRLSLSMPEPRQNFIPPSFPARIANRIYGWFTVLSITPSYSFLLAVKGRKSDKIHRTPVNLLEFDQRLYLVGTRGYTQWSHNAASDGEVTLLRGRRRDRYRVRALTDSEKPEILQHYLRRFHLMSGRFFSVPEDASLAAFAQIAHKHPVFELFKHAAGVKS